MVIILGDLASHWGGGARALDICQWMLSMFIKTENN